MGSLKVTPEIRCGKLEVRGGLNAILKEYHSEVSVEESVEVCESEEDHGEGSELRCPNKGREDGGRDHETEEESGQGRQDPNKCMRYV